LNADISTIQLGQKDELIRSQKEEPDTNNQINDPEIR
jgi:hypothetical protein